MREPKPKIRIRLNIRKNDQVRVMAGRDKGKVGRVLSVNASKGQVTVEHANIIKRHTRPNPSQNVKGGILDKEGPIAISNVLLMCPACNKHARVGRSKGADGSSVRVCRRCGATLEK
ncbi:MAG TPA: 50S ribosomal protein L24 [Candidatus Acidoferrales bacterium]|jgi:large subunit ribosomal protein L24|nr:50S ribosomal protein L24 [Candidatus Acidoferrales bacterium]